MALIINNQFAEWFQNNVTWTKMVWWKTNFNMPVPDIFDNNTNFNRTTGMLTPLWQATSFDLSGFRYWWEILAAATTVSIDGPFAWWTVTLKQIWRKPNWNEIFTNEIPVSFPSIANWDWYWFQIASNQWIAPWEVDINWTYSLDVEVSWAITWSQTFNLTFTNVPVFPWYKPPGYVWVDWNDLKYISANWFEHTVVWLDLWNVWWTPGSIWSNDSVTTPVIYWIDSLWHQRLKSFQIKQFPSTFSNWATSEVSWQTPWYMYMDNEFWWTHISHIGADWYKYLLWDWEYPY